jgi:CRP-like cAMP-binding protein
VHCHERYLYRARGSRCARHVGCALLWEEDTQSNNRRNFMAIDLRTVRSTADKAEVYRLRHKVFVAEEQRFHLTMDHIYDRFDSFEETSNFLALDAGEAVAGVRLVLDGPAGLPAQHAFDFEPLRRTLTGGCATVGWFCIRKAYRRHPGLVVSLIQMCFRQMRSHGGRHVLAVVHPPVLALMQRLVGARPLAPQFEDHALGVPIVPVHVDLENLPPGSRERFVDPEERLFEDSCTRRLYRKNQVIFLRGDDGGEVFQVLRGVVRIQPEGYPLDAGGGAAYPGLLLGPGQFFGELSALDGRTRSGTLVAHSEDVDLMVWSREAILDQLQASPECALRLCRMLAARLRGLVEGVSANNSEALAARLLVGAAGRQNQPVDARWLAGQCGLDRQSLSSMVLPWAQERMIAADDTQAHIWVIDRGRLAEQVWI